MTDCKALKYIYGSEATDRNEGRLGRFALRLQEYTFDVQHRAGKLSGNVDFLSRYPLPTLEGPAIEPLFAMLCAVRKSEEQATVGGSRDTLWRQLSNFCVAETRGARAAKGREAKTQTNNMEEKEPVAPVEPTGRNEGLPTARAQPPQTKERDGVQMRGPHVPEEKATAEKTALRGKRRKLDRGLDGVAQTISLAEVEAKATQLASKERMASINKELTDGSLLETLKKHYAQDGLGKNLMADPLSQGRVQAAQEGRPVYFVGSDGLIRFGFEAKADQPLYVPTALRSRCCSPITGCLCWGTWVLQRCGRY